MPVSFVYFSHGVYLKDEIQYRILAEAVDSEMGVEANLNGREREENQEEK